MNFNELQHLKDREVEIAKRVRVVLIKKNYTLARVAKEIGVSGSGLFRLLTPKKRKYDVSPKFFYRILTWLESVEDKKENKKSH